MSKSNAAEPMEQTKNQINENAKKKKDEKPKQESLFTAEKAVIVTGITATAVATAAVVFFYATAGIPFSVALVLILIDSASVILMGALATSVSFYGVLFIKELFSSKPQQVMA